MVSVVLESVIENIVPDSCPAITLPKPSITVVPPTTKDVSHPVPMFIAVSVPAVPLMLAMLMALRMSPASVFEFVFGLIFRAVRV